MARTNLIAVSTIRTSAPPTALAVVGGIVLAVIFIVLGLPFLLTGEVPKQSVTACLLVLMASAAAWTVRRLRGSEMRKHGGWQLWSPALVVAVVAGLLLLTACDSDLPTMSMRRPQAAQTVTPTTEMPTPAPLTAMAASALIATATVTPTIQTQTQTQTVSYFVTPIPAVEVADGDK